jgi:hypothetical protein
MISRQPGANVLPANCRHRLDDKNRDQVCSWLIRFAKRFDDGAVVGFGVAEIDGGL